MKKLTKAILVATIALATMFSGCKTGMLAPRSGELFQTTRMGPGKVTMVCSAYTIVGFIAASEGVTDMIPVAIARLPIAVPAIVWDECIVSPLIDLVCLPYDLCQPNHGFYIRVVDESGSPVPNMKIDGCVYRGEFKGLTLSIDGVTDAAGEFYVPRLFNLGGDFRASAPGYMPWFFPRGIKLDGVKPEADGRIVIQFVARKSDLGEWKAKTDISREEILSILPGKWSADSETRKLLALELNWPSANDADKHCFTISPSESVVSRVPKYYSGAGLYSNKNGRVRYLDNLLSSGYKFTTWKLHRKGELKLRRWITNREQEGWLWAVHLSEGDGEYSDQDDYYLGEDQNGLYLSPGFDVESKSLYPKITLKFRKVTE